MLLIGRPNDGPRLRRPLAERIPPAPPPSASLLALITPARRTDTALSRATPAHAARPRRMPPPRLVPPIVAVLHPPVVAPTEVCAAAELHIGVLHATP